jgi:propanol-preferring alcohol dehydrogenase
MLWLPKKEDTEAMRAMQLLSPKAIDEHPLERRVVPNPTPAQGQVRLRVSACGVCHTDLHTVEGELELPKLPIIPGHQIVGEVDAVGPDVTRLQVGDRVGVGWLNWSCGECAYCRQGQENLCPDARFTGLHADGGYAEYVVVDERFAYSLPEGLDDLHAAPLLCAGIIGYRSLRLSEIQPGGRLGLYGFGASAHLAIQVARFWDCEVYAFSRGEEHRRLAAELGAMWTGLAQDHPPCQLDGSVIFAPAGWIVPLALGHLRPGGTLAINAIHMSPIPEMPYELLYGERTLRSVTHCTRRDAEEFLRLAGEIPVRTAVEVMALDEANVALQRLKRRKVRGGAVLRVRENAQQQGC